MWSYEQLTGRLRDGTGNLVGVGYSGKGVGKNAPSAQRVHNVGPIPRGEYRIQGPQDTVTHGPFVLPLIADPANEMFGRYGFLIHGDSVVTPGIASEGCIILARDVREAIWASVDHDLLVTITTLPVIGEAG